MKKNNLLYRSLFSLAFGLISVAASGQRFEKLIETRTISNHEIVGAEYESTSKSIFILANVSNSNGDGLLIKVNSRTGDTLWSKYVASTAQVENFKGLYASANALYAYGSRTYQSYAYAFLAKLDFNGDTVWTKHYKSLTTTSCSLPRITLNGFVETSTGDLVMVGRNNQCDRAVFLKANSTGSVTSIKEFDNWNSSYYSPLWEFYDIQQSGANFLVSARYGKATSSWTYYKGIWKLDSAGDTISHFNSSFAENSEIFNFKVDGTGNMYLLGKHNPISNQIGLVEKFNSSGVSQWTYSPTGVTIQWSGLTDAEVNSSGDIFISGYFQKQNQSVDQFVVKLNSSGTEAWLKQYGYGDNGYGQEIVSIGTNYALISKEGFGWNAKESYGVNNSNPPHSEHPIIQIINGDGAVGKFSKTPGQDSKVGKLKFFAYASFSFSSDSWSNIALVPITLASPTGGNSGYNSWNNNYSYEIWRTSQNSNGNGVGTFYFTAQDKNGDLRSSDTLEVLPFPSYSALDQYGSPATAACSGDSLLLSPDVVNVGSIYKWFFTGASNNLSATKVGTSQSLYVKNKGYYFMREILSNGDSAQTEPALLNISTDQAQIFSSDYPQSFWVSGEVSDSLTRPNPSVLNLAQNTNNQHWLAPVGRYRQSNVQQYYYSTADLVSRGLSSGSTIDEIGFVFEEAYSGGNLEDFKISLKWNSTMPSNWVTLNSNQIVYENYWQNPSSSDGEIHFDINDQIWDGTSALVIQVSYRVNAYNVSTDVNPIFKLVKGASTLSRFVQANNTTTTLIGNTGSGNKAANYRPLTKFKMALPAKEDTIVSCGSSISISVSNTGYQLLSWNTSATSASINVTNAGEYSVTMIDGNFCLSYDTVQVVFNPNTNSITASADTVVSGSSVTLTGQNSYLNLWSNGASGNTTTVTSSGAYTLTSINSDGCPVIDTATVVVLDLPVIYKGNRALYRGAALVDHTYMGEIGNAHVYYSTNCYSFNAAQSTIGNLGGKFWYPKDASENALINSLYKSKISCCGGRWIGIKRSSTSDPWKDVYGNTIPYENWDVNADPNRLYGYIEFSWNGFWNGSSSGTNDCREYFIGFEDESSVAGSTETACDSIKLWTPEGYDSYIWTNGATTLTSTSNEIWASASGSYTVTGVRNSINYNSTAVQLTINESPTISITNKSGTTDLNGTNSITLKANYPAGATLTWLVNGQSSGTNDSIVSNTIGWHTLVATLNGCSSRDSVKLFAPIYVSKAGNDGTGTGTLAAPFKTINHAISQASAGARIYVLKGTYTEDVLIDKPVQILSNYNRLGHIGAIDSTIIVSSSGSFAVKFSNSNSVSNSTLNSGISGFTLKGKNDSQHGSALTFDSYAGNRSYAKNLKITDNTIGWGWTDVASAISIRNGGGALIEDVEVYGNNPSQSNSPNVIWIQGNSEEVLFSKCTIHDNYASWGIVNGSNYEAIFENCNFYANTYEDLFKFEWSPSTLILSNTSASGNLNNAGQIFRFSTTAKVLVLNSVLNGDRDYLYYTNGGGSITGWKSVLNYTGLSTGNASVTLDIDSCLVVEDASLNPNNTTKGTFVGYGYGDESYTWNNNLYTAPEIDIFGNQRPNPTGSKIDVGAFESVKTIGDFDISITECGFDLTLNILNSNSYLVEWNGPGGFQSFNRDIHAPQTGSYTVSVYSMDRSDTLTETYSLVNPLMFTVSSVKDVCEAVSLNSGKIQVIDIQGGSGQNYGTYYQLWATKTSGYSWQTGFGQGTHSTIIDGLTSGKYIVKLNDFSGCSIYDTVNVGSSPSQRRYVSVSGSDLNPGSQLLPFKSIQHAINQSCDRDTIVLTNGTYIEQGITVDKPVTITSMYAFTNDSTDILNTSISGNNSGIFTIAYPGSSSDTSYMQLIGLTIKNASGNNGGAIYLTSQNGDAALKVKSCLFIDNQAQAGGAIYAGSWTRLVVTNTTFKNNHANSNAGAIYGSSMQLIYLRNSRFVSNTSSNENGAISIGENPNSRFTNLTFKSNSAQNQGAIGRITVNPGSKINNVSIVENVGGANSSSPFIINFTTWNYQGSGTDVTINNLLFAGNVSQYRPWIKFEGWTNYHVVNSTFTDNTSRRTTDWSDKGNICVGDNVHLRLLNSIVTKSNGNSIIADGCGISYVSARYSVIEGGSTAIKNESCGSSPTLTKTLGSSVITTAPYFVDRIHGDYHLANFASSIGAGRLTSDVGPTGAVKTLNAPNYDLSKSIRPIPTGSNPDLGVYEHPSDAGIAGLDLVVTNNGVCQSNSGAISVQLIDPTGVTSALAKAFAWTKKGDAAWGTKTTSSITGLTSGIYYVTVTAGSTILSDSAEVVTAVPIQISNASISANCFGGNDGTLKFSITGGSSFTGGTYKYDIDYLDLDSLGYSWTDPNSSERSANYTYNNLYPGSYRVVVTDKKGCQFVDTVVIGYRNSLPDLTLTASGPVTFCNGETVTLTAATTDVTDSYLWQDGSNFAQITVGNAATWRVTVTDTAGCITQDSIVVDVKTQPTISTGAPATYSGQAISADIKYLGEHQGHHYYINTTQQHTWTQAKAYAESLGGHLWVINDANEQSAVNGFINAQPNWYGEAFCGAYYENGTWKWVNGDPFSFTNWNGNSATMNSYTLIRVQFNWGGQWERWGYENFDQKYIMEFPTSAIALNAVETHCDSITVWAPEGFDVYSWSDPNTGTVFGTDRTMKVTSSMTVKVTTTLNKTDNTSCQMESQNYTININNSPVGQIVNHSGTLDLFGGDTVTLGANYTSGSTIAWFESGVTTSLGANDTLLVTTPATYVLSVTNTGCETRDSVRIDEPIFVATTGSNTTGDGSLANPYKTIQHGINQSSNGGKVYVLPGTYNERILIDKPLTLASDVLRTGDTNAVRTTIIKPGSVGIITSVSNSNTSSYGGINVVNMNEGQIKMIGFSVKDYQANYSGAWDRSSVISVVSSTADIDFENLIISGSKQGQGQGCCNAAVTLDVEYSSNVSFNDVRIKNNGDPSWTSHRLGYIRQSTVNFENSRWTGNDRFNSILRIGEGAKVNISNSVFANHGGDDLFELDESNASVSFNHVTIVGNEEITNVFKIGGSNNKVYFINSALEDDMGNRWMYAYGSNNSMFIANSIVGGTNKSSFTSSNLSLDTNGLTQFISPALNTGGGLKGNSPAIGNARTITQVDGKTFSSPLLDLKKISRPNPTGSNPDAGAFESPKSQGDFDVAIDACGYELTSQVFNSSNYLVQWSGPSGYFSISKNITAPRKGLYTLSVFSLDRNDTITKTLNLNNPLTFEIMTVKDVCEAVSSNSGRFMFGQVKGGTPYTSNWWTHTFEVKNSSGTVIDGWQFNSPNWTYSRNNASAGRYYIEVTDGAGCTVVDSLDLESKLGQRWYVSTTGSDANPGTELLPLKSVQLAYDLACDQDTIIIEDGTYYENLQLGDAWQNNDWQYAKPITIASRFILDGLASHIDGVILNGSDEAPVLTARFNGSTDSSSNNVIRLVGMTFTRGNAISYNWWGANRGGGLALFEKGYVLENLKVRNNNSSDNGGGIFIDQSAILRNVDVYNNSAPRGAGIYLWNISELDWENVNVFENSSSESAGGVGIQGSMSGDITISGMNIYNNQNTGWSGASALQIESWGSGTLTLKDVKVTSNTNVNSDSWGAVYVSNGSNKGVVFENALIAFNKGGWVSGVNVQNSADVSFVNSTIYKNTSRTGYTGTNANSSIYLSNNSELNLYNSILGGQTGYNIIFDQGNYSGGGADCDVNIKNSLIQGGTSSTSILTTPGASGQVSDSAMLVEPVYLKNPGQGDFSLAVMSAALGAANSNPWLNPGSSNNPVYLNMPQQDLYGQNRPNPVGSNADLGAIESNLSTAQFGVAFEVTSNPACNPSAAQIKATAKHPNGGPYKYSWISLDGNTVNNPNSQLTSGAYTISNLYAGWYKLTVQKYSGSTVVETIVDSVEITQDAPIVLNLDKTNENCENENNGALQVDVAGGSGRYFITWTYPGGGSIANAPSTISSLAPGNYSVTVTDDRGCTAQDTAVIITAHPTPVITITSSIAKPGSTLSGNDEVRMCVGDVVTLDAGSGFADYNWTSLTVSANQYSTRTIEAFESETYYLSVVDSFGCANTDTARVYVVYPPVVYASNLNVATGASLQGVTTTVMGNNESVTEWWNSSDPHPYGSNQRYGKVQFVIRASELYQSGLTQNTNINSLSLYVEQSGSSAMSNMTISMGHTGQSAMTNWETGLQQVFTINNYFPVSGTWNIHNFANEFKWDGAQNILVEVCFDYGANNPSSVEILKHQIYGNVQLSMSSHSNTNADNCSLPGNTQYSTWRPNVQLGIDKIQAVDTIRVCDFSVLNTAPIYDTYKWYVNGSQIPDTTVITVANTATSMLRVTDAASGCILWSDTIVVQVDSTSAVNITSDLPLSGTLCLGDTVTLSTNKAFAQYFWSNGSTAQEQLVTKSETFVLKAVSENGCPSYDTARVAINIPPDVYFRLNGRVLASTDQSLVYSSGAENCTEVRYVPSEDKFDVNWGATNFIIATGYQAVVSEMDSLLYPWVVDHAQAKDWILHRDTTDTQYSGPNTDATSADGHGGYLLFNPYSGTDENKTAAIVSPCINLLGTNQPAMVFNYHMFTNVIALGNPSYAQQMGSLKVEVQDVTTGETGWTTVWMRETPTSTNVWVTDTADLSAYAGHTVKLRLKAQAGTGGPNGEIAVDGISFTDVNPSNPVLNRVTPETVCEGDILEAGSSDVLSNNMSYVWNTGETGANLKLHTTGWYSVTLVDSNNCEISTDSVYVLVNPEPVSNLTVSASDTLQYCDGQMGNVVLQVPGGFTEYAWYLNGGLENTSTDTLNTGVLAVGGYSYTAIITDSIGCTSTSEAIGIDVRALPSLQASVTDANCYGDTNGVVALTVTGNGGYTFDWSNGDTTATILNLGADTLTVFVTDSFSCESTIDVVVNQPTAVNSYHYSVEPDCFGGSDGKVVVNTFGGVAPYHFNWTSLPNALDSVEVTFQLHGSNWNSTTYSVAFTNGQIVTLQPNYMGDSTLRATVKLPANQTIYYRYYQGSIPENVPISCGQIPSGNSTMHRTLNVSSDVTLGAVCYGQCSDCNGVFQNQIAGNTTYGNKVARGLSAGPYAYTVTDAHGCSYSVTDTIVQPTLLTVAMDSYGDLSCYQSGDGFINLTVAGGTLPYSYNWSTGAISEDLTNLQAGTYAMTVTDNKGCTASWSGQISEPAVLEAQGVVSSYAAGMNVTCNGANDGSIDVSVTGGTMPYTYTWSNSASTQDLSSLTAGTYAVTVTDTNGCTDALSFTLMQPASMAATTSQMDVDCFGGDNGSITVNATGGTAPYAVDWTSATGASSGEVAVSFQVNMGGQTWSVGGIELFVQSYGTHLMTDFAGDSIYRKTLTFMPGDTIYYRYAKSSVPENVPTSCGIITGSTLVQRYVVVPAQDTTLSIVCFASCTDCDGVVRGNANGAFMTGARTLNGLTAGVYTFNMVDLNGCTYSVTDTVDQPTLLVTVVDTTFDATCPVNNDGGIELHATGGVAPYTYQWSNGSSQNNQLFLYAGMYSVLITDMNGCTDSSSYILNAPQPFDQQEICVLSVDSLTGKNLIVWEHTPGYRTSDYVLLKENSQGQYVQIGTQSYTSLSVFTDLTSIPQQQPDRYRIAVLDSCGTMSDTSDLHRTIHLQSNIGSGGEINLIWTPYEGRSVQTYEIFRWITSGNLVQIGSVSGGTTTFTDLNPPVAPNVYYVINAVFNGDACSPTLGKTSAFEGSKSNILNQTGIGTPELPWRGRVLLYPNPSTGNFRIEVPTDEEYQIVIYNAVGKRLLAKSYMETAEINLENVAEGLYYVEIQQEGSVMSIEKINIVR